MTLILGRLVVGSSALDVVRDAHHALPDIMGDLVEKIVVLDMRIKKMRVRHIVKASVDKNGLVDNRGVNGCWLVVKSGGGCSREVDRVRGEGRRSEK